MSSAAMGPVVRITTLESERPRRGRLLTAPLSIAVHLAALAALVLVPVLTSSELPQPASGVRAFLVEPPSVAAPPPPPPPAPAAPASRPTPAPPSDAHLVAPVSIRDTIAPEAALDLGLPGGVPGGVAGGVEGGVVGGIIGGLPDAPAHAVTPIRVGGQIREPKKLRHVAPDYPLLAKKARVTGMVVLEAIIDADGRVGDVSVLRSIPLLDEAAVAAVRQWVYTPTLLDGVPVPVIMTVTLRFSLVL